MMILVADSWKQARQHNSDEMQKQLQHLLDQRLSVVVAAAAAAVMGMPAAGSQSLQPCCASSRAALAGPRGRAACSGSWTSCLPGPAELPLP